MRNASLAGPAGVNAVPVAFVALVAVLTAPWGVHWQKPWSRILTIRILHYVMSTASTPQLQWLLGTSLDTYTNWSVKNSCEPVVDEIGEGSRLLWLGERRCDRVILYVPGMSIFAERDSLH